MYIEIFHFIKFFVCRKLHRNINFSWKQKTRPNGGTRRMVDFVFIFKIIRKREKNKCEVTHRAHTRIRVITKCGIIWLRGYHFLFDWTRMIYFDVCTCVCARAYKHVCVCVCEMEIWLTRSMISLYLFSFDTNTYKCVVICLCICH